MNCPECGDNPFFANEEQCHACGYEEESEGLVISMGKDGKAEVHKQEDWIEVHKNDWKILEGFLEENKKAFEDYCKKHESAEKTNKEKQK